MTAPILIPVTSRLANFSLRLRAAAAWLLILLPALAALVFVPQLASPFLVPKAALVIALSAVCCACALFFGGIDWSKSIRESHSLTFFLLFVWIATTWLLSPLRYMGSWSFALTSAAMLLFFAAQQLLLGSEQRLFVSLSFTAGLIAIIAIAQRALGFDPFTVFGSSSTQTARMRVFATLGNPDFVGEFLAACLPAITSLRNRVLRWILFSLVGVAILCTGSRAATLAAIVAAAVLTLLHREWKTTKKLFMLTVVILLLATSLAIAGRSNPRSVSKAIEGRLTIWRVSLHQISWRGTGIGTFSYVYLQSVGTAINNGVPVDSHFITPERHAQNDFVEIISETGPIGGLLVFAFFALWAREVWRCGDEHLAFAYSTVAALLTAAMFDFPLHRGETLALMAVAMALPLARQASFIPANRTTTALRVVLGCAVCVLYFSFAAMSVFSSRLQLVGSQFESQQDFASAATAYRRASRLCPDNTDAWFAITRALARQERYGEALETSFLAERYIAEPELWILRARILESMNENEQAVKEMQRAEQLFPYSTLPKLEIEAIRTQNSR